MEEISYEKLNQIFEEIVDEFQKRFGEVVEVDKEKKDIIFDIVTKINNLPNQTPTTIAELINYNSKEAYVEPLYQGEVSNYVNKICAKLGIELIKEKTLGGLAYMVKFQKR